MDCKMIMLHTISASVRTSLPVWMETITEIKLDVLVFNIELNYAIGEQRQELCTEETGTCQFSYLINQEPNCMLSCMKLQSLLVSGFF